MIKVSDLTTPFVVPDLEEELLQSIIDAYIQHADKKGMGRKPINVPLPVHDKEQILKVGKLYENDGWLFQLHYATPLKHYLSVVLQAPIKK